MPSARVASPQRSAASATSNSSAYRVIPGGRAPSAGAAGFGAQDRSRREFSGARRPSPSASSAGADRKANRSAGRKKGAVPGGFGGGVGIGGARMQGAQARGLQGAQVRGMGGAQVRGAVGRGRAPQAASSRVTSVRVGDVQRAERADRIRATYRRHVLRLAVILAVAAFLVVGGMALYFSDAFSIEEVQVEGVEHLTSTEMAALANVPSGTTLLRVDTGAIEQSLLRDAWVKSVSVNRVFPHTLQIVITERTIAAVVEVPSKNATAIQPWAIASDGMWLMGIPDQDSELGQSISQQIYEDAASVLHITDVPYGTSPETGAFCTDENVNNALDIVSGMTTDLADQVVLVRATDAESTTLTLENGVEIAFGKAENIRDKERVCLEIMEQNPGTVAYINVRVVDRPTWRSL